MKPEFVDIPDLFYSFEEQQPFSHCIECGKELDEETDYVIEKAFRRYPGFSAQDTLFDYAMCIHCTLDMRQSMSAHSLKQLDNYFLPHFTKLQILSMKDEEFELDELISSCLVTGESVNQVREYQVYAYCRGNKLNTSVPPYMISEAALDAILPLLSDQTTDFLNGFYDKHFSPDPSMMEPVGPRLILV